MFGFFMTTGEEAPTVPVDDTEGLTYISGGTDNVVNHNSIEKWGFADSTSANISATIATAVNTHISFGNTTRGIFACFNVGRDVNKLTYSSEVISLETDLPSNGYRSTGTGNSTTGICVSGNDRHHLYNLSADSWSTTATATAVTNHTAMLASNETDMICQKGVVVATSLDFAYLYNYAGGTNTTKSGVLRHGSNSFGRAVMQVENMAVFDIGQSDANSTALDNLEIYTYSDEVHQSLTYMARGTGKTLPKDKSCASSNATEGARFGGASNDTRDWPSSPFNGIFGTISKYNYSSQALTDVGNLLTLRQFAAAVCTTPGHLLPAQWSEPLDNSVAFIAARGKSSSNAELRFGVPSWCSRSHDNFFMLAAMYLNTDGTGDGADITVTLPAGWTLLRRTNHEDLALITAWKLSSGETDSSNLYEAIIGGTPATKVHTTIVVCYDGIDTADPIHDDDEAVSSSGTGTITIDAPIVDIATSYTKTVYIVAVDSNGTVSSDSGSRMFRSLEDEVMLRYSYTEATQGAFLVADEHYEMSAASEPRTFTFTTTGSGDSSSMRIIQAISLNRLEP